MERVGPVELVVAAFNGEERAGEVLKTMKQLQKEGTIFLVNAAVLIKKADGAVSMQETEDISGKQGALFGAVSGALMGLLAGPGGAIVGAIAGAATGGAAASKIDMGFSDVMLKELQDGLEPGSSAVVALIQHAWVDRVLAELDKLDAKLFHQALKSEIVAQLAEDKEAPEPASES